MIYLIIAVVLAVFYGLWQYSYKWAKKNEKLEEIEDDPSGNSNINKKFIDHM